MRLAFDLDGTLYDTLTLSFDVDEGIRRDLRYEKVSREEYKTKFQSRDWRRFYRDLGIREEHIEFVLDEFIRRFKAANPPHMIPGAKEALQGAEKVLGHENIFIVTNETPEGVQKRFQRDGLMHYLDRIENPFQGKAIELHRLATGHDGVFTYVGDLVSDGEDCSEARRMGATNIEFYGITHPYAMNPEEAMKEFVRRNEEFAKILNNLRELDVLWSQR
ncbi:MAG: HAD hydrolase-like protein [Candidatus Woesearchaeota archaeon]|nr:HAD hydrolase-like protein [Candidatus Woesearchaeota archaeon]